MIAKKVAARKVASICNKSARYDRFVQPKDGYRVRQSVPKKRRHSKSHWSWFSTRSRSVSSASSSSNSISSPPVISLERSSSFDAKDVYIDIDDQPGATPSE